MYLAYAVVFALVLTFDLKRLPRPAVPAWMESGHAFAAAIIASLGSFLCALAVDAHFAERTWRGVALPFAVVGIPLTEHARSSDVATVAAVVQTLAMLVCWARLRRGPLTRPQSIAVWSAAGICLAVAVAVPVLRSADVYAYAGYTVLADPYHLQRAHVSAPFRAVESLWSYPMIPSVYGPLWTALSRAAAGSLPTLAERLYALRALALVAFALVAIAYARLRDRQTALVLFAANPALVDQYVVDAHNDLWGVALVLAALLPRARPLARLALLVAAGSIKLPLLIPGAIVFANARGAVARFVAPGAALAIAAGLALALKADASQTVALQTKYRSVVPAIAAAHYALAAACLALVAGALAWRRYARFGGCTTVALGINPNPWYLGWGFPYAVAAGHDRAFLVAFPLVASLADSSYDATPLRLTIGIAVFVVLFALAARELLGRLYEARDRAVATRATTARYTSARLP